MKLVNQTMKLFLSYLFLINNESVLPLYIITNNSSKSVKKIKPIVFAFLMNYGICNWPTQPLFSSSLSVVSTLPLYGPFKWYPSNLMNFMQPARKIFQPTSKHMNILYKKKKDLENQWHVHVLFFSFLFF